MEEPTIDFPLTNATFEHEEPYDIMNETWIRVIIIIIYAAIFITGICGNLLVIYVVLSKATMRTNTNLFILNLGLYRMLTFYYI